jgi:hypothetical protein
MMNGLLLFARMFLWREIAIYAHDLPVKVVQAEFRLLQMMGQRFDGWPDVVDRCGLR